MLAVAHSGSVEQHSLPTGSISMECDQPFVRHILVTHRHYTSTPSVQRTLEALMRTGEFHRRLQSESERVRRTMEETLGFVIGFKDDESQPILRKSAERFVQSVSRWPATVNDPFDVSDAISAVADLETAADEAQRQVLRTPTSEDNDRNFIFAQIRELQRALYHLKEFLSSQEVSASLMGRLV